MKAPPSQDKSRFGISQTLNFLSRTAFGEGTRDNGIGRLYRVVLDTVGAVAKRRAPGGGTSSVGLSGNQPPPEGDVASLQRELDMTDAEVEMLEEVLLCSRLQVLRVAVRCRDHGGGALDLAGLVARLVGLRGALPECNIAVLVERSPGRLLAASGGAEMLERVGERYAFLVNGLPGADVPTMILEDPALLFDAGIEEAVAGVHIMWPDLTAEALQNSCPVELCLLLRSFSPQGPPVAM